MKRILAFLLSITMLFIILTGCTPKTNDDAADPTESSKIKVVTTIFPPYDFTRAVAGDFIDLTLLLPPGSESHSYEPSPQDIIKIQECDLFIYGGGESDAWIDSILESIDTSTIKIVSMMDLVSAKEEELKEGMQEPEDEHDHSDETEEEPEYDEHVWTSPINAIAITKAISAELCALDAENAEVYQKNTDSYVAEIQKVDASFRSVVKNSAHKTMIFGDRFPFRYFADEYGLDYYAAFPGCSADTEASAQTVAFLIDKVKAEQIPVVFHIEFSNEKLTDSICESTGAEKRLFHSCHNVTKDELDSGITYVDLMEQNVQTLEEALS